MGANLSVGPRGIGQAQLTRSFGQVAELELDPAQAVGDEGVTGRELQRTHDQGARFGQTHAAFSKRIAQRVVRVGVVGLERDDSA